MVLVFECVAIETCHIIFPMFFTMRNYNFLKLLIMSHYKFKSKFTKNYWKAKEYLIFSNIIIELSTMKELAFS